MKEKKNKKWDKLKPIRKKNKKISSFLMSKKKRNYKLKIKKNK